MKKTTYEKPQLKISQSELEDILVSSSFIGDGIYDLDDFDILP